MEVYSARICIEKDHSKVKFSLYDKEGKLVSDEEINGVEVLILDGKTLIALNSLSSNVLCVNVHYPCMPKKEVKGSVLRLSRC